MWRVSSYHCQLLASFSAPCTAKKGKEFNLYNSFQPQAPHRHDTNPAAGPSNMCQMAHLRARRPISAEHPSRETAATNLGPQFLRKSLSIPIGWMSVLVSHIRDKNNLWPRWSFPVPWTQQKQQTRNVETLLGAWSLHARSKMRLRWCRLI